MVINETGNVGINTTTPEARFDIKATGDGAEILRFSTSRPWVFIQDGADGPGANLALKSLAGGKSFFIKGVNDNIAFSIKSDNGNSYFNGKMGIGTTNPTHELDVKGTIHAKEVIVDLDFPGPDYVFEPDYDLKSLSDLDQFLKTNKRLPEIPSAAQMKEEGVNMVEMQMLLLKKVEELTLHQINLHDLVEKQQSEIEVLKKKINQ